MFWNNSCTFYNYLKRSARLSPSPRSWNRPCRRTATSIHSCLIFQKTPFIVHGNNTQDCFRYSLAKSITGCIKFTKRTELWIDFWQLDDIFEPPGQNELIIWKTESRFFFLSPHLPYLFGHLRLTRLLLRCSDPSLNQFGEKNPTVLQSNNYADRGECYNILRDQHYSSHHHTKINFIIIIIIINIIIIYNSLKIFLDKLTSSLILPSKTLAYFFTRFSDMDGCFFFLSFFFFFFVFVLLIYSSNKKI